MTKQKTFSQLATGFPATGFPATGFPAITPSATERRRLFPLNAVQNTAHTLAAGFLRAPFLTTLEALEAPSGSKSWLASASEIRSKSGTHYFLKKL